MLRYDRPDFPLFAGRYVFFDLRFMEFGKRLLFLDRP